MRNAPAISGGGIDKAAFVRYTVHRKGRCDKRFTLFRCGLF